MRISSVAACGVAMVLALAAGSAHAQMHDHAAPADTSAGADVDEMDMSGMAMSMTGMYGPYAMTREASGTAWQPDRAEHYGLHVMRGDWMLMLHGSLDLASTYQGGARGDDKVFADNMVMGMAQHPLGPGTIGFRTMLSAEPATIGKNGYPLLLQTGETADGVTPLVDRQHPHDLFMELATSFSVARGDRSLFVYGGLPGEPALGPPAFMHRFSGLSFPEAPITHHWLDSTHITFGVLTAGAVVDRLKFEASSFRGREPDQERWNIETPKLDSWSYRLSFNPTRAWALQISHGHLASPEQLEPDVDQDRTTASAIYDGQWNGGHWEGMLAWGNNRNTPGHTLNAFTAEVTAELLQTHTLFARIEGVEKDELFEAPDARAGQVYDVGEFSAGYRYDFWRAPHLFAGIGALGKVSVVPASIHGAYGDAPLSALVFMRVALR